MKTLLSAVALLMGCQARPPKFVYLGQNISEDDWRGLAQERGWKTAELVTDDGLSLRALELIPPKPSTRAVLWFGGNSEFSLRESQTAIDHLLSGTEIPCFTFAPRGYDGNSGVPSRERVEKDAENALQYVLKKFGLKASQVLVGGFSWGTYSALYLGARRQRGLEPVANVMVFAPLTTIDIAHTSSSKVDRYDAMLFVKDISVATTLIHGDQDTALPLEMSKTLEKRLPRARLEVVPGVDHLGLLVAAPSRLAALRVVGKETPSL